MNTKALLDQLLASGQAMLGHQPHSGGVAGAKPVGISDFGKGALAGGALGLLLGHKGARKLGGSALKYGSVAALGALAYRAYTDYQRQNGQTASAPPQTADRVSPAEVERHSDAVLRALVAAAKADGHIDARERGLIEAELAKLVDDAETRRWFAAELAKPLDPAEVASAATTPELAAEMYLASLLVVDQQSFMERAYLDELARQMRLPPALKETLERQSLPAA